MKPTKHKDRTILPPQYTGNKTGAEAQTQCDTRDEAVQVFERAKHRMLDINHWDTYGSPAKFWLTDTSGARLEDTLPRPGNLIRIDLPGPGPRSGKGYDWVKIEQFDEKWDADADIDFLAFRVRPTPAPDSTDPKPSHFYTDETTSTFIVQRVGTRVTACEKGRNEIPNTDTDSTLDNIRNGLVATGATLGLSILQWKSLMEGWLKE